MRQYFKKYHLFFSVIYCSLAILACGNTDSAVQDSPSVAAGTATTISGSAVKGPIDGAEMRLFYFRDDGLETEIIAENTPVLTTYSGAFDFQVSPDDLEDIQTPLILRSTGGTMGGQPAPQLETIIPDPGVLRNSGQKIQRHLTTASSVAVKMLRHRVAAERSAPLRADAEVCITKVEEELEVDLEQDPADASQAVAMVNLNVDENLDLFNSPENNASVEEYIEYLASNLNSTSGRFDDKMDDPEHPGEDREAEFDRERHGRLSRLFPDGPSRFLNLRMKVDKPAIAGDGVDAATINLKLRSGRGRSVANGTQIDLSIISGEGSLSTTAPTTSRGRARATFTSTVPGKAVIQASYTLENGNTIAQEIVVAIAGSDENAAPVANAGSDQNVSTGTVVTLNGSQSSDPNNDPLAYTWTLLSTPAGSSATVSDPRVFNPVFTADVEGVYIAELVVNDELVDSSPSTVTIAATSGNSAPVADAGPDQNVTTGSAVTLNGGGSSDADSDPLTYAWALITVPAGSSAALTDATLSNPTFTADLDGVYGAELVVNDGTLASAPVAVSITAASANSAPTADAGPDQNVATGTVVTLDGSGSSDADADPLTYGWTLVSRPAGSNAALVDATGVNPFFTADVEGVYVAELVVSDGSADSVAATVSVTASRTNSAPAANAGPDQSETVGAMVFLDGSGSSDADNDPLTYAWTLVSGPGGSSAVLPDPADTETVFFMPDVAGTYVVQLVVNDGMVDSASAAATITVTDPVPALDGAALYSANCASCHGADGTQIRNLRGISAAAIESTLPHQGVTLNDIEGSAGAQAMADFLGP